MQGFSFPFTLRHRCLSDNMITTTPQDLAKRNFLSFFLSSFLSCFLSCYRYLSINKLTTGREDDNPSQHAAQFSFLVVLQYWSQFSLFLLSSVRLLSADIVYPFSEHKSEAMLCIAPSSCPIGVNFLQHVRLHLSGGPLLLIDDTCVSKTNHTDDQLI